MCVFSLTVVLAVASVQDLQKMKTREESQPEPGTEPGKKTTSSG